MPTRPYRSSAPACTRRRQSGAATLIVVMLLFFVMSLTAAYASRNLIFEQRTSANQYRSTQVFEASQAGIEWALAMLNSGRVDSDCVPTADATQASFRQRYLVTNGTTGVVTAQLHSSGVFGTNLWAACSFDGAQWRCKCPAGDLVATDLPAGTAAFAVRFVDEASGKPGTVRIEANGCGSYAQTADDLACLRYVAPGGTARCRSTSCVMLALFSGAKSPPTAAVTALGDVTGASLAVYNSDIDVGGITIHAGGANLVTAPILVGLPGTPGSTTTRTGDTTLSALDADAPDCTLCMFSSIFGLRPATFQRQMGAVQLDCSAAACGAAAVNAALATTRSRVVVLTGAFGLTLDDPADVIGAATDPVVLAIIDGPLTITAAATASARINGLVYANSAVLAAGEIRGALVSASTVTGNGTTRVVYDRAALDRVRLTSGSYVRIPGSWRDHQ